MAHQRDEADEGGASRRDERRKDDACEPAAAPPWDGCDPGIWRELTTDPADAAPASLVVRHTASPFVRPLDPRAEAEPQWQAAAVAYLTEIDRARPLGLPEHWLPALGRGADDPSFGWLPLDWPPRGDAARLLGSAAVVRSHGGRELDRTVVLVAAERIGIDAPSGSEFGLNVVGHQREAAGIGLAMHIVGVTAALPFGGYRDAARAVPQWVRLLQERPKTFLDRERPRIATSLRLDPSTIWLRGIRVAAADRGAVQLELRCAARGAADALPYAVLARYRVTEKGIQGAPALRRTPLVAHAIGHAELLLRDPASQGPATTIRMRRPRRSAAMLDSMRTAVRIGGGLRPPLLGDGQVRSMKSPYVRADLGAPSTPVTGEKRVDLPGNGPALRSDDLSAVAATYNVDRLFRRLADYGLAPATYFRVAALPIDVHYRSGVRPGPGKDGETVNARVQVEGWRLDITGPTPLNDRPRLAIHCALGDAAVRDRGAWNGRDRAPAEPLGIANDPRWMWHEIGHVLTMASIGELEFRFAHSAGDALAAIACDPQSDLAADSVRWRGATFPWIFTPRRHDRSVRGGWSWCGTQHRALFLLPDAERLRMKGYRSEQILSSSLFRAYRALGGDTVRPSSGSADRAARQSASHYALYLIMKGINLLSAAVPPTRVDDFVSALMFADSGTEVFAVPRTAATRVGGCAHKVLRWAFQAQGLYAKDPHAITNAPGEAPPVDLYIADRRPARDPLFDDGTVYAPGGYVPVSLDWGGGATPAWHATATAVDVDAAAGRVEVEIGNCGAVDAIGASVAVWTREWPANTDPPRWNAGAGWTQAAAVPAQTVPAGGTRRFGPFSVALQTGKRYLVLAQATSVDDRAITDAASGLATTRQPTALNELVAGDNNLGLRVVRRA